MIKPPQSTQTTSSKSFSIGANDLYSQYEPYLNAKAKRVIGVKANGTLHQYNTPVNEGSYLYNLIELVALLGIKTAEYNPCQFTREVARVHYFGFTCHPYEVDKATLKLVAAINEMADRKWIMASLYNLGMIELHQLEPKDPKKVCVVSYLAVPYNKETDLASAYGRITFPEGGIPPEFK